MFCPQQHAALPKLSTADTATAVALPCLLWLQGIFSHPWFAEGLNPAALQFNNSIVQESLANQPSPEVLNEVRAKLGCGGLAKWRGFA